MTDTDLDPAPSSPATPASAAVPAQPPALDFGPVVRLRQAIVREVGKVVVGQEEAIDGMIVALLARGHVLLEGVPGTAKTLMVRTLAASVGLAFGRIQFTPDLMPSDILGTHVFEHYIEAKRTEWQEYIAAVHPWEVDRYLTSF